MLAENWGSHYPIRRPRELLLSSMLVKSGLMASICPWWKNWLQIQTLASNITETVYQPIHRNITLKDCPKELVLLVRLIVRRNGTGDLRFPHLTFSVIVSFVVKFVNLKGAIRIPHAGDVLCCVEQPNEVRKNPSKTLSWRSVILEEIIRPLMSVCE